MTTTAAGPSIDLLLDINAAFNARDVDRILSFFDDDATFLMARGPEPNGRRVHGKPAIGKVLADRFKVISDMRWDHIEHFVTGNRAVSVWMVTGTSADGEALNYQGATSMSSAATRSSTRTPTGKSSSRRTGSSFVYTLASLALLERGF